MDRLRTLLVLLMAFGLFLTPSVILAGESAPPPSQEAAEAEEPPPVDEENVVGFPGVQDEAEDFPVGIQKPTS